MPRFPDRVRVRMASRGYRIVQPIAVSEFANDAQDAGNLRQICVVNKA